MQITNKIIRRIHNTYTVLYTQGTPTRAANVSADEGIAPISYADALRSKGSHLVGGKPDGRRVQAVPARRSKELVIAPGTETATQKHRTSLELVGDINSATDGSGDAVAARRLPSGDVLVAFQGALEKQK